MTQNYDQTLSALLLILRDYWLLCIAFAIFMTVVKWKILNKAGQGGWKQFIPIYNVYLEYKLYWETSYFWILLLSPFMLYYIATMVNTNVSTLAAIIGLLIIGVVLISPIILQFKKAKAFGQSFWFGLGLLLLNTIFLIALAFDSKCIYRRYDGYEFRNYRF